MAPGVKNNPGFTVFDINRTLGHQMLLNMHEVKRVVVFQFIALNQMHIAPCCFS